MHLPQKRIWLIGASEGIGRETAKRLAACGALLCVSARNQERLDSLLEELDGTGHMSASCDVTDINSMRSAYEEISASGNIDAVIFNAGMYEPMGWEDWNMDTNMRTLDVNVHGAFRMLDVLRDAINDKMLERIVLVGSVAGYRGLPKSLAYGASKAAVNYMADALRLDLQKLNVKLQLVTPGFVETRLTDKNDFDMPMRISAEEAARAIVEGIEKDHYEIHFPRRFTYMMKLLRMLPHGLYFSIAKRL